MQNGAFAAPHLERQEAQRRSRASPFPPKSPSSPRSTHARYLRNVRQVNPYLANTAERFAAEIVGVGRLSWWLFCSTQAHTTADQNDEVDEVEEEKLMRVFS